MSNREQILNDLYNTDCTEDDRLVSKHGQVEFITTRTYIDKYLEPDSKLLK